MRTLHLAAAVGAALAGCSGSSKPDTTARPDPGTGSDTAGYPVLPPPGDQEPPPPVDATPDKGGGAGAAREAELAAIAGGFIDAFVNSEPLLTRDKRVVFVSNRDGLPQLYIADAKQPQAAAT